MAKRAKKHNDDILKLREWLTAERKKILDDERYHYKPANVLINAPLALIQVEMKARMGALEDAEAQLDALKR